MCNTIFDKFTIKNVVFRSSHSLFSLYMSVCSLISYVYAISFFVVLHKAPNKMNCFFLYPLLVPDHPSPQAPPQRELCQLFKFCLTLLVISLYFHIFSLSLSLAFYFSLFIRLYVIPNFLIVPFESAVSGACA